MPVPHLILLVALQTLIGAPPPASPSAELPAGFHRFHERVLTGPAPSGDADFDRLQRLGIRTVISVDAARPDLARAEARGMRLVHVPIRYATITDTQQALLARAIGELPGPVYLHCHHGRHRGPAAAGIALVSLGLLDNEDAVEHLRMAGTSPAYPGLYQAVEQARTLAPETIAAAGPLTPHAAVTGLAEVMSEIETGIDHLRLLEDGGWSLRADHPDLDPLSGAGTLHDHLRSLGDDPEVIGFGAGFREALDRSIEAAADLERALAARPPSPDPDPLLAVLRASCVDCHRDHRDGVP